MSLQYFNFHLNIFLQIDLDFHGRCCEWFCSPDLMTVVSFWKIFSTFCRHLCAAFSGVVLLAIFNTAVGRKGGVENSRTLGTTASMILESGSLFTPLSSLPQYWRVPEDSAHDYSESLRIFLKVRPRSSSRRTKLSIFFQVFLMLSSFNILVNSPVDICISCIVSTIGTCHVLIQHSHVSTLIKLYVCTTTSSKCEFENIRISIKESRFLAFYLKHLKLLCNILWSHFIYYRKCSRTQPFTYLVETLCLQDNIWLVNKLTMLCLSRGNVLTSGSKVCRFKSDWGWLIFSGRKNPEHKSSRRDFKLGVPSLRFQAR